MIFLKIFHKQTYLSQIVVVLITKMFYIMQRLFIPRQFFVLIIDPCCEIFTPGTTSKMPQYNSQLDSMKINSEQNQVIKGTKTELNLTKLCLNLV